MRINTNVSALNTQRILGNSNAAAAKQIGKLSSGFRINRAADDAAGLGIANKLRADIRSMKQASRNAEQANSLLQIAEGSTDTIQGMLDRMKELATQAASDTVGSEGRAQLQKEFDALVDEIDRTVNTTEFQGTKLLDGSNPSFKFMVSSSGEYGGNDTVSVALTDLSSSALGSAGSTLDTLKSSVTGAVAASTFDAASDTLTAGGSNTGTGSVTIGGTFSGAADATIEVQHDGTNFQYRTDGGTWNTMSGTSQLVDGVTIDVSGVTGAANGDTWSISATAAVAGTPTGGLVTMTDAEGTLGSIDAAIGQLSNVLGDIGAAQNRIEYATSNVKTSIENFAAAESTIRDADMAAEMTEFSRVQILQQAGTAMLAQANQAPQGVLQLLR